MSQLPPVLKRPIVRNEKLWLPADNMSLHYLMQLELVLRLTECSTIACLSRSWKRAVDGTLTHSWSWLADLQISLINGYFTYVRYSLLNSSQNSLKQDSAKSKTDSLTEIRMCDLCLWEVIEDLYHFVKILKFWTFPEVLKPSQSTGEGTAAREKLARKKSVFNCNNQWICVLKKTSIM